LSIEIDTAIDARIEIGQGLVRGAKARTPAAPPATFRVAQWNTDDLNPAVPANYAAQQRTVQRVNADIWGLNEINRLRTAEFVTFANELGYPHTAFGTDSGLGTQFVMGVMSKFPILRSVEHTSVSLSGDATAVDLQNNILQADIQTPLGVCYHFVHHFVAGFSNANRYQRGVDAIRLQQAIATVGTDTRVFVHVDVNENIDTPANLPRDPNPILHSSAPGAPYKAGADIVANHPAGIVNDPFYYVLDSNYVGSGVSPAPGIGTQRMLNPSQIDGEKSTQWGGSFWNRFDYVALGGPTGADPADAEGEVYNSALEPGGLPKTGPALASGDSLTASDHLPVFVDVKGLA